MDVLVSGDAEEVLAVWDDALTLMLTAEDLDGMATALYTVGGPVKMDALFEAYVAAAGSGTHHPGPAYAGGDPEHDQAAGRSSAAVPAATRPPCWPRWPAVTSRTARRRSPPGWPCAPTRGPRVS